MQSIQRLITTICSTHLEETKVFYTTLFDFHIEYDSDWFIQLLSKDKSFEIGIMDKTSELIPAEFQTSPKGFYLSFVVDSADEMYNLIQVHSYKVVQEPHDTFYGQRRLLVEDPSGTLVDISSPIPNFSF